MFARTFGIATIYAALWLASVTAPAVVSAQDGPSESLAPLFAFQNGVRFGSSENEAQVLKELGYAGVSQVFVTGEKLAEKVAAYDKAGLKVLSVYLNVDDKPIVEAAVRPLAP